MSNRQKLIIQKKGKLSNWTLLKERKGTGGLSNDFKASLTGTRLRRAFYSRRAAVFSNPIILTSTVIIGLSVKTGRFILAWIRGAVISVDLRKGAQFNTEILKTKVKLLSVFVLRLPRTEIRCSPPDICNDIRRRDRRIRLHFDKVCFRIRRCPSRNPFPCIQACKRNNNQTQDLYR